MNCKIHGDGSLLAVMGFQSARRFRRNYGAIISIEDPCVTENRKLRFLNTPHPPHLVLSFLDTDTATSESAQRYHLREALDFAGYYRDRSLLVHCHAGVSRSTAITYAILCDRLGKGNEDDALDALFSLRPAACPNLLVTQLADELLGRDGRMVQALEQRIGGSLGHRSLLVARRCLQMHPWLSFAPNTALGEASALIAEALNRFVSSYRLSCSARRQPERS